VEQQIPWRAGASWRGPRSSMNGVSSAGARTGEQPVPGIRSDRGDHREMLVRVAEADGADQPGDVGQRVWTAASCPSSMVTTKKMAAGVNGAVTGCGSGSGHHSTLAKQAVRNDGEPCPDCARAVRVHRRVTVAVSRLRDRRQGLSAAGSPELSERDEWRCRRQVLHGAGGLARRMAIRRGGPHRAVSDRRRPHRQPQSAVKQHPDRFVSGWQWSPWSPTAAPG